MQAHRFPQVTLGPVRNPILVMMDIALRDALTKEQLVVYVYVQVITFVKSFLVYVRWDQVWGAGGHSTGCCSSSKFLITRHNALQYRILGTGTRIPYDIIFRHKFPSFGAFSNLMRPNMVCQPFCPSVSWRSGSVR